MKTPNQKPDDRKAAEPRWPKGMVTATGLSIDTHGFFRWRIFARITVFLAVMILNRGHAAGLDSNLFRMGFSSSMFTEVNENDARAAVEVWGQTVAREHGVPTDPEPLIFKDHAGLLHALTNKLVDVVALTTIEFGALSKEVRFAPIFVTYNVGQTTEQYVLLVHRDSKIERLADLRGRSLVFHQNLRACLAPTWLDTLLVQKGLPPAAGFVSKLTVNSKLAQVVLPVFFRQSDACVVTRRGFDTMNELNPQVGKQLKIIATSPEMVPAVFAFRADYASSYKEKVFAGIRDLHKTPAGQQVLTIFHSEKIEDQPAACLDSALALMATHEQLCGRTNTVKTALIEASQP